MSKAKDTIEEVRKKFFERKKQEVVENAEQTLASNLDQVVYDVIQDPKNSGRSYIGVKIRYDLETMEAVVEEIRPFEDKTAGMSIQLNKENVKYLFEKNRSK